MPPLFVIGAEGDAQLVNYRVRSPYLIVDRLFGAAELRLGGKQPQVARIERSEIGRAACRGRVCHTCRSRWSPYHSKKTISVHPRNTTRLTNVKTVDRAA